MPGPPTPLSGCHLERLEIHDGFTDRLYDASRTAGALTLSLEAQRSPFDHGNDLVLQVRCGLQRVLSFRLTDLLTSPNGKTGSVRIERSSQRLSVESQQHDQRILATFVELRDFSVAACMLKKFGFQVKDGIQVPAYSPQEPRPSLPRFASVRSAGLGPRLSAIAGLPRIGAGESQGDSQFSLTSMLDPEVALFHAAPAHHPFHPVWANRGSYGSAARLEQRGVPHTPPQEMVDPSLNPYFAFSGNQVTQNGPAWAGSPFGKFLESIPQESGLREPAHSVKVDVSSRASQGRGSLSATIDCPTLQNEHDARSNSPDPLSMDCHEPSQMDQTDQGTGALPAEQDIHQLMPQPRQLPFLNHHKPGIPKKTSKPQSRVRLKARPKAAEKANAFKSSHVTQPRQEPLERTRGLRKGPLSPPNDVIQSTRITRSMKQAPSLRAEEFNNDFQASPPLSIRAEGPFDDASTPPSRRAGDFVPECQASPHPPSRASPGISLEPATVTALLVTDHHALQRVNKATSDLLDQYQADIAKGCNQGAFARFYATRIHEIRRDFWVARLMDVERGRYLVPAA